MALQFLGESFKLYFISMSEASKAAEASFVASFYLALGCFSCVFNFSIVIRELLGIRGEVVSH